MEVNECQIWSTTKNVIPNLVREAYLIENKFGNGCVINALI
jgi:hypothetical protein